jgi:hypothetical protein
MRRGIPCLSLVVSLIAFASSPASAQAPKMNDRTLASRPFTDADLEKYVAILAKVTQAHRERGGSMTAAVMKEMQAKKEKACADHGWTSLDYGVVDARMMVALQHMQMEKTVPVPARKKADVEIARKFKQRIDAAKK